MSNAVINLPTQMGKNVINLPDQVLDSKEDLIAAVSKAEAEGWSFIPYEDPRIGEYGAVLSRICNSKGLPKPPLKCELSWWAGSDGLSSEPVWLWVTDPVWADTEETYTVTVYPWGKREPHVTRVSYPNAAMQVNREFAKLSETNPLFGLSLLIPFREGLSVATPAYGDALSVFESFTPKVWYKAYDAKTRMVGFVHYETPGVATIVEASLLQINENRSLSTQVLRLQEGATPFPSIRAFEDERFSEIEF